MTVPRAADARRFHDVRYTDLVADPLREVRRLYLAAGLELAPSAKQRMERWLDRHRRRRRVQHRYALGQLKLDPATVEARFRAYQSL